MEVHLLCEKYWKLQNPNKNKVCEEKENEEGVPVCVGKPRQHASQHCLDSWATYAQAWACLLPSVFSWQLPCHLHTCWYRHFHTQRTTGNLGRAWKLVKALSDAFTLKTSPIPSDTRHCLMKEGAEHQRLPLLCPWQSAPFTLSLPLPSIYFPSSGWSNGNGMGVVGHGMGVVGGTDAIFQESRVCCRWS